jgi:hypothetical protein
MGEQLRGEMRDMGGQLRVDIVGQVRGEMRDMGEQLRGEMGSLEERLRTQITETQTQMRVLHEDLVGRLAVIQEGQNGWKKARGRSKRR